MFVLVISNAHVYQIVHATLNVPVTLYAVVTPMYVVARHIVHATLNVLVIQFVDVILMYVLV